MKPIVQKIQQIFQLRGDEKYAGEEVTQLQHALHCAKLALQDKAPVELVVAALLHDIGHILGPEALPASVDQDLHDLHEESGFAFLAEHFPAVIADPVRLHVAAKRWLCSTDPTYTEQLSPTSYKSFLDQGGPMSDRERLEFEAQPNFAAAVQVRRWDDQGKNPHETLPHLEDLIPLIEKTLA